ncbi:MAG: dicarboxylate/amino acid:cation symporter [Bdellovibrionaceae bacterium]|nr:dicarboxylate/amino acid:cation symporter [Pseudobdellovibrionaceae bacterium]|tara:strand:+ start:12598 stop:13920 length:1323 start_codon:yes stop_codon:yes gene_type:complete
MKLNNISPFHFARSSADQIRSLTSSLDLYVQKRLWLKIVLSMILGMLTGFLLGPDFKIISIESSINIGNYLALPGQIFLGLIQLVVIPLVFASIILGIVGSDSIEKLKTMGSRITIYFVSSTIVSILIGFSVALLLKPGQWIDRSILTLDKVSDNTNPGLQFGVENIVSQLLPQNLVQVLADGEMLQVVLLAIFLGIALMSLRNEEAKPLVSLLNTFQKLSMVIIGWSMKLAPIAVFGLSAQLFLKLGIGAVYSLAGYILSVLLGLLILFFFYLILVKTLTKVPILKFISSIKELQLLAFSTSSSASVMPLSIETAEKKLNVKPSVSQFIIPLGTTINMDGTALYQGVATIFLAQVFQVELSIGQMFLVIGTATLSSIGAPGTPGVGMAILASILSGVGIPSSGIFLILGVDRLLDMTRTVLNVTGDITAALIINQYSKE